MKSVAPESSATREVTPGKPGALSSQSRFSAMADKATPAKRYWLLKSEPDVFSITHLEKSPGRTTCWDGVRNYQARNFLRDQMQVGDGVLFHHSNADPPGIAGIAEVVRTGYPDTTAFDPKDHHYDEKSDPADPTWYMVDIRHVRTFPQLLTLPELKAAKGLEAMELLRRGSRLSVQPVTAKEWQTVLKLAEAQAATKGR